nr:amidohydrolase [Nocardia albiluteola]
MRGELAELYTDLHQHPELSLQEFRTAAALADRLRQFGFDTETGVGGTGVVAALRNGEGPVVMLRADIDALPVQEKTGLDYASTAQAHDHTGQQVPVMHACGHDMHATCLIGAAAVLAHTRSTWSGTLVLVCQPAEELARGARAMIADGLFERFPKPAIILAQHVGPLPAGMIGYGTGAIMASWDSMDVVLHGRGGHGSRPEAAVDPVLMAASVVTRLQRIVAREVAPIDTAVVTVGRLQAGTKGNIIPDTAELSIDVRTYTEPTRALVCAAIERIVRAEAAASGAPREPEFDWTTAAPALVSDPTATTTTVATFEQHFGKDRVVALPPLTGSEDAGILAEAAAVPMVYWFWGGIDFASRATGFEHVPANHAPDFAPDIEPTLTTGVQTLVLAALTWLGTDPRSTSTTSEGHERSVSA